MPRHTHREIAVRITQAIVLYLVGGLILYNSVLVDAARSDKGFSAGWYLETVVMWPTGVTPTGVAVIVSAVLVLFAVTKVFSWIISRFQSTLASVPSRRAFLGFMLLAATLGAGVGMATEPLSATEHSQCQDVPDSAFVAFEGVYQEPSGDLLYFAGGTNMWMFEGNSEAGDWDFAHKTRGYGRTGYAYEGAYERNGEYYYVIANDTSLTFYEKNRTAIGTQRATVKSQFDFVARCTGETDV